MKVGYYKYWLERHDDHRKYRVNLGPFLSAINSHTSIDFKLGFSYNGEYLFLLPVTQKIFLFVMTRQNEIIKSISSKTLSVEEIYSRLRTDELLGFASYVLIDEGYFGLGSTVMAPKVKAFSTLVNSALERLRFEPFRFDVEPMMTHSTKADALAVPFIGRSVIQVTKGSNVFERLIGFSGTSESDAVNVDSFEIIIKPRLYQNVDSVVKGFIRNIPDAGLAKMVLKARDELHEHLIDLYVVGEGAVADTVNSKDEKTILVQLEQKARENELLREKIREHMKDDSFEPRLPKVLAGLADVTTWPDTVRTLPGISGRSG